MPERKRKTKAGIRRNNKPPIKRRLGWAKPLFFIALIAVIITVLFWQWPTIISWAETNIGSKALELFDWGLVILFTTLITLGIIIWQRKLHTLITYWNRWLGSIPILLAIWGVLAFFNLGGSFGLSIINQQNVIGILRIFGLIVIGLVLIMPQASLRFVKTITLGIANKLKRKPKIPRRIATEPTLTTSQSRDPAVPKEHIASSKTAPEIAAPTPQNLKQVAQEVWRKYGESPSLITVNGWRLPPIDILDQSIDTEFNQADNAQRAALIEQALASYGVEVKVIQINPGPTVTQFGVEPGWDRKFKEIKERDRDGNTTIRLKEVSKTRVKVDRITSLANDLALTLAAPTIRIEAPVPGKPVVGIEVPNKTSSLVTLREVIETNAFQKLEARSQLTIALGKGAGGEGVVADLGRMPHLLIAGATGSGKTVCLNTVICCLLFHNSPSTVRFIMIDPKRVELTPYNSIPQLATPVIVDVKKALATLRWLNLEMDKRYQRLAESGARNIEAFNRNHQGDKAMPYLVLIVDELADLMMAGFDEVEHILCRLAQLARATGIHLVVATQRPSVDVVTGLIKANFPTRISFAVTSQVDSRTILDGAGAEKLLGRGDMLYMPTEAAKPKRLQGCFVSDAEIERLVYFWGSQKRDQVQPLRIDEVLSTTDHTQREYPKDPLLEAAKQLAQQHNRISTSFLQRKLHIGYPRAARIMEQLEEERKTEEE